MRRVGARNRNRGDAGQVVSAVVVVVVLGLLLVTMSALLPLGEASDQRTGTQSAADAAALGAAEDVLDDLPLLIAQRVALLRTPAGLDRLLDPLTCGRGAGAAQRFAAENGADVTAYCYVASTDRFEVRVRNRDTASTGNRAQARSTAELGLRLGPCRPEPPAPGAPPAEPDDPIRLVCGDLDLDFDVVDGVPELTTELADLLDPLEPRLVR